MFVEVRFALRGPCLVGVACRLREFVYCVALAPSNCQKTCIQEDLHRSPAPLRWGHSQSAHTDICNRLELILNKVRTLEQVIEDDGHCVFASAASMLLKRRSPRSLMTCA
jgi:hypothetical protein